MYVVCNVIVFFSFFLSFYLKFCLAIVIRVWAATASIDGLVPNRAARHCIYL